MTERKSRITSKTLNGYTIVYLSMKPYCKVFNGSALFWSNGVYLRDHIGVRSEVMDCVLENGATIAIINIKNGLSTSVYQCEIETLRKKSKKFKRRNGKAMEDWMELHLKHMKLLSGSPLWKQDPLQTTIW